MHFSNTAEKRQRGSTARTMTASPGAETHLTGHRPAGSREGASAAQWGAYGGGQSSLDVVSRPTVAALQEPSARSVSPPPLAPKQGSEPGSAWSLRPVGEVAGVAVKTAALQSPGRGKVQTPMLHPASKLSLSNAESASEHPSLSLAEAGSHAPLNISAAPQQLAQSNPGASPQLPVIHHIAQQIVHVLPGAAVMDHIVELHLSPHELGHLRLMLTTDNGQIHVTIHPERADVLDLMRRHSTEPAADFTSLGYQNTGFSFGQWAQNESSTPAPAPVVTGGDPVASETLATPTPSPALPLADGLDLR